jgi:hypothetical protein
VVGWVRLILVVCLDARVWVLHVAARSFLLMRRMRMILGLEVLGLMRCAFATAGHRYLQSSNKIIEQLIHVCCRPSQLRAKAEVANSQYMGAGAQNREGSS